MVTVLPKPCCLVYFATRISAYLLSSSVNNGGFPLLEENNGHPEYIQRNSARNYFLGYMKEENRALETICVYITKLTLLIHFKSESI